MDSIEAIIKYNFYLKILMKDSGVSFNRGKAKLWMENVKGMQQKAQSKVLKYVDWITSMALKSLKRQRCAQIMGTSAPLPWVAWKQLEQNYEGHIGQNSLEPLKTFGTFERSQDSYLQAKEDWK